MGKRKYKFDRDHDGKCINPQTSKPFQYGDVYNGIFFRGYSLMYPIFVKNLRKDDEYRIGNSRTLDGVIQKLHNAAKERSKKHKSVCTITRKWIKVNIEKGFILNNKKIIDYSLEPNHPFTPSIDRIDSENRNYTEENCQILPTLLNIAKNRWKDEDFLKVVEPYIEHLKNKN